MSYTIGGGITTEEDYNEAKLKLHTGGSHSHETIAATEEGPARQQLVTERRQIGVDLCTFRDQPDPNWTPPV